MIKHIVTWKLDESYPSTDKEDILNKMQVMLLELKNKIEVLKSIEVFLNSPEAPSNNSDIVLDTLFESFDDLKTYANHPEHVKVVGYFKTLKMQRAAIDFVV